MISDPAACLDDADLVCYVQCIIVSCQSHIRLLLSVRPAQQGSVALAMSVLRLLALSQQRQLHVAGMGDSSWAVHLIRVLIFFVWIS